MSGNLHGGVGAGQWSMQAEAKQERNATIMDFMDS